MGTLFPLESGFQVFLGEPAEFPALQRRQLSLAPGRKHSVDMAATHISTDTSTNFLLDMAKLSPETRGCRFEGENKVLVHHSRYTQATCRSVCHVPCEQPSRTLYSIAKVQNSA